VTSILFVFSTIIEARDVVESRLYLEAEISLFRLLSYLLLPRIKGIPLQHCPGGRKLSQTSISAFRAEMEAVKEKLVLLDACCARTFWAVADLEVNRVAVP
jgi:hypothetical protein